MSATIKVQGATFDRTPGENQTATVMYRLASDPDVPGSYITVTTNAPIVPSAPPSTVGTFTPEVDIPDLLNGTAYVVKAVNNCNGSSAEFPITTPLSLCVAITGITGTSTPDH